MDHHGHDHSEMMHHMSHMNHTMDRSADVGMSASSHGHDHMGMSMSGMMMYFHFGVSEVILFESWQTSTVLGIVSSMLGIFIVAALYEGLKYFRENLFWKNCNPVNYENVENIPGAKKSPPPSTDRLIRPSLLSKHHLIQTFLHLIQIVVSYLLMLIFMTYNVWLCLAVALGSATGYFLFGWKKTLFTDVTEHCH